MTIISNKPMTLISDKQVRQFHEQGYFVTEPMFPQKQLDELSAEFDRVQNETVRQLEKSGADAQSIEIAKFRPFLGQFHTHSAAAAEFVKAPIYLEACAKLIGPDADLYYNQAVIKPPEKGKSFAWHQDSGYKVTKPLAYITCWTAITRSFVENGCIWVIPGSHKLGILEHKFHPESRELIPEVNDESGAIPVEVLPGQVAIFSSLTLHKSGANVSRESRKGYVPQYHVPNVVGADNGQLEGDQYPVLRGGKRVG